MKREKRGKFVSETYPVHGLPGAGRAAAGRALRNSGGSCLGQTSQSGRRGYYSELHFDIILFYFTAAIYNLSCVLADFFS